MSTPLLIWLAVTAAMLLAMIWSRPRYKDADEFPHCTCNHNWRIHDMDGHCAIAECGCKKFEEKHSKRTMTKDAT